MSHMHADVHANVSGHLANTHARRRAGGAAIVRSVQGRAPCAPIRKCAAVFTYITSAYLHTP